MYALGRMRRFYCIMIDEKELREILQKTYPDAKCELDFNTPFQLLVATILSAQCTDKRVNQVTEKLFAAYSTPQDFAALTPEQLEPLIFSCGFYRNKAKNIIAASRSIVEKFGGEVPTDFDDLLNLAGVGRKTANVVSANAFGADAIAVDTHCFRVGRRLGLSDGKTPEAVEKDLSAYFGEGSRASAHHLLIFHGRYTCHSRKPECEKCPLTGNCRYFKENS